MIQKKVCIVGAFGVGKTSLVARYVRGIFDERYMSTLGVKIDRKPMVIDGQDVQLVVWDVQGEEETRALQLSYVRGASGILYVADGTRRETIDTARSLRMRVQAEFGDVPHVGVVNKGDLGSDWELSREAAEAMFPEHRARITSAKSGEGVEACFETLARHALAKGRA